MLPGIVLPADAMARLDLWAQVIGGSDQRWPRSSDAMADASPSCCSSENEVSSDIMSLSSVPRVLLTEEKQA